MSHVTRTHKLDYESYLVTYDYDGIVPKCGCGCGENAPFTRSQGWEFRKFIHGHHANIRIKSQEEKDKIGAANSVLMKEFLSKNPERSRQMIERAWTGITAETQQKKSIKMIELYTNGGFDWKKGYYESPKTGKRHHYRSSWELLHMQSMDSDPLVETYESEPFCIPYEWNESTHRYLPDFVVKYRDGHRELHEIGVKKIKLTNERDLAKADAARKYCLQNGWAYRLITEFLSPDPIPSDPITYQ